MGMFEGKKILILGVANERSIGYGILQSLRKEGADVALTYMNEAIEKRVRPIASDLGCNLVLKCDLQSDSDISEMTKSLESQWGRVDGIVHSVAFADKEDLSKPFSQTSRAGFSLALDVSAYSLVAVAGALQPLMKEQGGAIVTLSYLGAERVIPNYNVMGVAKAALEASVRYLAYDLGQYNIRVNAISAGPIKTLAAAGIPQFREMLSAFVQRAPLRRTITLEDVGNTALYLMGPLSSGITGETHYVDCGYNVMGM